MSDGISAMWDDAEHYEHLAEMFEEHVRVGPGRMWPYNMDEKHYEELKKRYREREEKKV
jgi:hypothetical protein